MQDKRINMGNKNLMDNTGRDGLSSRFGLNEDDGAYFGGEFLSDRGDKYGLTGTVPTEHGAVNGLDYRDPKLSAFLEANFGANAQVALRGEMGKNNYRQASAELNFQPTDNTNITLGADKDKNWKVAAQIALTDKLNAKARLDSMKNWNAAMSYRTGDGVDLNAGVRGGEGRKPYFSVGAEYKY